MGPGGLTVLLAVLSAVPGGLRPAAAAAAASEERPASPAVATPCWRVEQFVVAQECTQCSSFQMVSAGPRGPPLPRGSLPDRPLGSPVGRRRCPPAAPPASSRASTAPRPSGRSTRAAARPRWRLSASGASWAPRWAWRWRRRRSWCCGSACWTGGRWRRCASRSSPFSQRLPRAWSWELCLPRAARGEAASALLPGPGILLGSKGSPERDVE